MDIVVDIRTVPHSRTDSQYGLDRLPDALAEHQIGHRRIAELGGLLNRSVVSPAVNGLWRDQSFHNYADYALSEHFSHGLLQLTDLARERRVAMMCAEALWWRCHRRIVADYLLLGHVEVFHLMGTERVERAILTSGAESAPDGVRYSTLATMSAKP